MKVNLKEITGNWPQGYALDKHSRGLKPNRTKTYVKYGF